MAVHSHSPLQASRLSTIIRHLGDLFDHMFGEPYTRISLVTSRRHQLSVAMESARKLRRGRER